MAQGPQALLREICPPVAASVGGVGGNDGYLTAQQYENLLAGSGGGGGTAFQDIAPGGTDTFTVSIPLAKQPTTANYAAIMTIQSGGIFTTYRIPYASQTTSNMVVVTDGILGAGTLLGFTITEF